MTTAGSYDFNGYQVLVVGGTRGEGRRIASAFSASGASVTVTGTMMLRSLYDSDLSAFDYESVNLARQDSIDHLAGTIGHIDVLVLAASCNLPYGLPPDEQAFIAEAARSGLLGPTSLTTRLRLKLSQSPALSSGCVVNTGAVTSWLQLPAPPRPPSASWPSRPRAPAATGPVWACGSTPCSRRDAPCSPASTHPASRRWAAAGSPAAPWSAASPGSATPSPTPRCSSRAAPPPASPGRPSASADGGPLGTTRSGNISESPRGAVRRGYISPTRKPHGTNRTPSPSRVGRSPVHSEGRPLTAELVTPHPLARAGSWTGRSSRRGREPLLEQSPGPTLRRSPVGLPRRGAGGRRRSVVPAVRDGEQRHSRGPRPGAGGRRAGRRQSRAAFAAAPRAGRTRTGPSTRRSSPSDCATPWSRRSLAPTTPPPRRSCPGRQRAC